MNLFDEAPKKQIKQPFLFELRERPVFAMAGIWEIWFAPDGSELRTCSILTTEANFAIKPFCDRMPCILREEDIDAWLGPGQDPPMRTLMPYPDDEITFRRVNRRLNRAGTEGPDLLLAE